MLSEETINKVIDRVVRRIEQVNTYVLEQIGKSIAKVGKLTPSKAQQLGQLIKYGGDYDKIVKELARITNLNVKDIGKIFEEVAKTDYEFAKDFYKYRNKKFIPYKENLTLQNQVNAISRQTAQTYVNLSNTLAFAQVKNGRIVHTTLSRAYQDTLDKAILSVSQGKTTFQEEMYHTIKELASSGLKTINYASGRSIRLDSAIRMNMQDGLRALHNQVQEIVGEEFDADGVEISVHLNPAIDHEEVQGRQFSNEEYAKLNDGLEAKDYKGNTYTLDHDGKNGYRPISTMNCYHYIFSIVLGVSDPEYNDKELQQIKDDNNKGFKLDGKHYTMYEGTQLQRQLELELRKQKDTQIMAKASGNMELVQESQTKITQLTNKYRELNQASGLTSKLNRARVSGYRRTKVNMPKNYKEIEYAREHNAIWHTTENLEEIIKSDKIIAPSLAVNKKITDKVKYGSQFIEFKPELLENVNKNTFLYKGDGGNQYSKKANQFDNLMQMLKDEPKNYNELKFNKDLPSLKYIKKVYIRQDEPQKVIKLLKENDIEYEIYQDYRIRRPKKVNLQ
jgi:hypothetical protein